MPFTPLAELELRCQKPDYRRVGNWMARRITRPLALRLTQIVLPCGISAHAATLAATVVAIAAVCFFGRGTVGGWILGVILLHAWYLLDHVDGQLARYHGRESLDGAALDYLMHHTLNLLVPLGIGWGLAADGRGWILVGLAWGLGLLLLGLVNDVRYKAFIKRLKCLHGELRAMGGGGSRPEPPAKAPRRPVALAAWCARKACETHVILNLLALIAFAQWVLSDGDLVLSRVYAGTMAAVSLILAIAVIGRSLARGTAEREFAAWFAAPKGHELTSAGGFWQVERERNNSSPRATVGS